MSNLLYSKNPGMAVTLAASGAGNYSKQWSGIPGIWSSVLITDNLLLSAGLNNTEIGNDNAQSFGSGISTSWGKDSTENYISLGMNFLRGPDDFYCQNINLSIQKKIIITGWVLMAGFTKHYNLVNINVKDSVNPEDNFSAQKSIQHNHFRAGVYKKFEQFACGLESTISSKVVGLTFCISGYLP